MQKGHFGYRAWLTFFFIVFLFSCRKEYAGVIIPQEIVAERFFNEHRTNSAEEKQIIDYLNRLNAKKGFVNKTVERIGFPRWDKLVKYSFLSNSSGRVATNSTVSSGGQDSATNYIIPFVRDTQNYVNAAMFIKTDKGDTSISYLCDWQYTKFRKPAQISKAEEIAIFFMLFDRQVQGYEKFDILDTSIFRIKDSKASMVSLINIDSNAQKKDFYFINELCWDYTYSVSSIKCFRPGSCRPPDYTDNCDGCSGMCTITSIKTISICYTLDFFNFGGGNGNGSGFGLGAGSTGGGSGSNDGAPPSNDDGLRPGWRFQNSSNTIPPNIDRIPFVSQQLNLSRTQVQFLHQNPHLVDELFEIINEEVDDKDNLPKLGNLLLNFLMEGNTFSNTEIVRTFNEINNQSLSISDPITEALMRYLTLKYAILKHENSKLSLNIQKKESKIIYETFKDIIHLSLDGLGLIPFGGEVFDVINGYTYILEGDRTNAFLSFASAIPFAGYAASSVKALKAGSEIIAVLGPKGFYAVKRVNQSAFKRACGAVGTQVGHHVIPFHEIVQSHPLMQMAFKAGFDPNNAAINGKAIEAVRNSGNHTSYANNIVAKFEQKFKKLPPGGWDPISAKHALEDIISDIKKALDAQPGVHVDDLIF